MVCGLLLTLGLTGCGPVDPPLPPPPPPSSAPVDLDVGLTSEQSTAWRFTPEGSDLAPVDILRAMKDFQTGRLYIDALDHYGFLPSPASPANPYGLPVGWTTHVPSYAIWDMDFVSINCAACHTGQLDYAGQSMRIDGGSNMADIEALALSIKSSAEQMLKDPVETLLFVHRLFHLEPPEYPRTSTADAAALITGEAGVQAQVDEPAKDLLSSYVDAAQDGTEDDMDKAAEAFGKACSDIIAGKVAEDGPLTAVVADIHSAVEMAEETRSKVEHMLDVLRDYMALLKNRLQLAERALTALEISQPPGPGRDDPWGIIRNVLFGSGTELDAPTSIPSLYYSREYVWYHADGNTNSVMQRDIAQAVALGGFVDPKTGQSSLLPRAIWHLEDLMRTLKSPAWPSDVFGETDAEKVTQGKALFDQHCLSCHHSHDGQLMALDEIGTDPNRAESFLRPQNGMPFYQALVQEVEALENTVYEQAGISQEEIEKHEYNGPPVWRGTGEYQSRLLTGIWSTAPYLHNGSVPTLYDLLLPVDQRPATFQLGSREYDPVKVGYVTAANDDSTFTYDITTHGGANTGHEYGIDLSEDERWALVEYLKTL